jgi:hypothetical protein
MSLVTYGLKMQAAAFQLQLAFDANDTASMQDALRRMETAERMHQRWQGGLPDASGRPDAFKK